MRWFFSTAIAVVVSTLAIGGVATGQVSRPPAPAANLSLAPASAADVAALRQRLDKLEAEHQATRTDLANARLQLTATQNQLAATQKRLDSLWTAVRAYGTCNTPKPAVPGAVPAPCSMILTSLPT